MAKTGDMSLIDLVGMKKSGNQRNRTAAEKEIRRRNEIAKSCR